MSCSLKDQIKLKNNKPNVLYLSYTGLLEPLGRSQVLAYLSRLSKDYNFTIISFEKADDFSDKAAVEELREECEQFGVNWQPKVYHKKPRLLATLYDMWLMFYAALKLNKVHKYSLVHGRSYVASGIALVVSKILKIPFVFDMRALWVEELVAANSIKRGSLIEKVVSFLEKKLLTNSAKVVSLTEAAIPFLKNKYPELKTGKFTVIPTCVDLKRFSYTPSEAIEKVHIENVGTMGSVLNPRFRQDIFFSILSFIEKKDSEVTFKIVSKDSEQDLKFNANLHSVLSDIDIYASRPDDIAKNIKNMSFAIVTFNPGTSTLGTSPTRIAEFLACGIPVIVSENVGDTAEIITENKVGIAIDVASNIDFEQLWLKMSELRSDPTLANRCREVSESYFSAERGAIKYAAVYKDALSC